MFIHCMFYNFSSLGSLAQNASEVWTLVSVSKSCRSCDLLAIYRSEHKRRVISNPECLAVFWTVWTERMIGLLESQDMREEEILGNNYVLAGHLAFNDNNFVEFGNVIAEHSHNH